MMVAARTLFVGATVALVDLVSPGATGCEEHLQRAKTNVEPVETLPRALDADHDFQHDDDDDGTCSDASTAEASKLSVANTLTFTCVSLRRSPAALQLLDTYANVACTCIAEDDAVNCNNDLMRVVFATRCIQHDRRLKQVADMLIERTSLS
jgi:hypothetical protein